MEETRKIGDYSVKYSMYIGHKDIALGENPNADKDERYMCCFVETNAIFERYSGVLVSDDFAEMSYSTMTFQESEIYGEDVLEDTECNVEESVMQRMDIERVRTALKMLAPEERAIIQDFFFTESPIPVKELVEKYAMPKTSIYRKRDDALKKLKKILGNA